MDEANTLRAELIVITPSSVPEPTPVPTAPVKVMSPVPAVNVRSSPPAVLSSVPPKKISPVVTIIESFVSAVETVPVALNEAAVIVVAPIVPDCVLIANVSALETNRAPLI